MVRIHPPIKANHQLRSQHRAAQLYGRNRGRRPRKSAQEEIIVTGSRVRRKDLTTPAPVTVISRDQITASGVASIGQFLQSCPSRAAR